VHQFRVAQHRGILDQARGRFAEHDPTRGATDSIRCAIPTCSPIAV
jgi:hypothetical protein